MGTVTAVRAHIVTALLVSTFYLVAGCSNGRGSVAESGQAQAPTTPPTTTTFSVRGTVSGLSGAGLVVQLNGAQDTPVTANGAFAFSTSLANQTAYVVTVAQQPTNPAQVCTPQQASGTISGGNVTDVIIVCSTQSFAVGGTVSGLRGRGLVLRRNGEENLPIASDGAFTFATAQASGTRYEISVATQPSNPAQTCTVANASGTVGSGETRSVAVTCATNTYVVGGNVSGLSGGNVVLANSSDTVEVQASGAFAFPTRIASGGEYAVTVRRQPQSPPQTCTVENGAGTVVSADITAIDVRCSISTYTIGGTIGGLVGAGLRLQNNGVDDLTPRADGRFTFATAVQSGRPYNVSVASQPTGPAQQCSVENPSGVVGTENVSSIRIRCVTTEFTVGGRVSGLSGSGLRLQNNGADVLPIAANGAYTFTTSLPTGSPFAVSVAAQPATPTQECTVSNATGAIAASNVTNVDVSCVTSRFAINVVVTGLSGFNLRLRNQTGQPLVIHSNGTYAFPALTESGQRYDVTITGQPILPFQTCTVVDGQGTVGAGPVNIAVNCS